MGSASIEVLGINAQYSGEGTRNMPPEVSGTQVELSIVVPTFNERDNVFPLIDRLTGSLGDIRWEIVFVDDSSPDGTADRIRSLARHDRRVRLISRHNRRGLASAVIEGALAASSNIVAVMDGDLQHDEAVLPDMFRRVASDEAEVVSASRFLSENGADGLASEQRKQISHWGIRLANWLCGLKMSDPLTGFFVFKRELLIRTLPDLSELGFKILLDLVASADPKPRIAEVPFNFRARQHGDSKLDNRVMYEFALFFIEKRLTKFLPVPARFISFALINSFGILVHLAVLIPLVSLFHFGFEVSQFSATLVAMGFNYTANNSITYHDRKLKGSAFYKGFLIFALLCSVGIIGNVGVASLFHQQFNDLTYIIAAIAGALITVVWNYAATRAFVWGRMKIRSRETIRKAYFVAS